MTPRLHAAEFKARAHAVERLALLFGKEPRQFLGVLADFVGRGVTQAAAFGVRQFRPLQERFVGGGNRVVEIGRARLRRQADDFAGRGIADFEMIARGNFAAVDDEIKLLTHLSSPKFTRAVMRSGVGVFRTGRDSAFP